MQHILIIGGGYGGLKALGPLSRADCRVTLIDKNPYHYLQTDAYDFIANKSTIADMTVDLASYVRGCGERCSFVRDEILSIDYEQREVRGVEGVYTYDYVIIATGALTYFPAQVEGLSTYSNGVKTLFRALEFKQKFETTLYEHLKDDKETQHYTIVIGGAGLSGVEIAAEMAYIAQQTWTAIGSRQEGLSIVLVEGSQAILPGMQPPIVSIAQERLDALGVIVKCGKFISKVENDHLLLDDGEVIAYDFMIFTGGIQAMPIASDCQSSLNRFNQYCVDQYCRLEGIENVYAIGDVASITVDGKSLPSTAQIAEQCGIFCAYNIIRAMKGKPLHAFKPRIYGMFVALGGSYAVGVLLDYAIIKGYKAFVLKKIITAGYKWLIRRVVARGQ